MGFILSLFGAEDKEKPPKTEMEDIDRLKNNLVDVGFALEEVNYMIKKHSRKKNASDMDLADIMRVKAALSEQLDIAHKCLNLIKEK